jgi:hypothetical protein
MGLLRHPRGRTREEMSRIENEDQVKANGKVHKA